MDIKEPGKLLPPPTIENWPTGKYPVILADPSWKFANWRGKTNGAATAHYQCINASDIARLPVNNLTTEDCALFLWVPYPKLEEGLYVLRSWGFRYTTAAFVWNKTYKNQKPYCGLGFYSRSGSEVCLLGVKGKIQRRRKSAAVRQVITAPVTYHSKKPEEIYSRIEALFDGPYLELFARGVPREGWRVWGNEVVGEQCYAS